MNVLKSLVDWEKSRGESDNQSKNAQSLEGEASAKEPVDVKSRQETTTNFEKAKAHKSTLEAAISEVMDLRLIGLTWYPGCVFCFVYF